jgi:hypothetical protein
MGSIATGLGSIGFMLIPDQAKAQGFRLPSKSPSIQATSMTITRMTKATSRYSLQ